MNWQCVIVEKLAGVGRAKLMKHLSNFFKRVGFLMSARKF